MKKFAALIGTLGLIVSLSGCGGGETKPPTANDAAKATQDAAAKAQAAANKAAADAAQAAKNATK